ncbi:MAG: vitamin K epoxide reductase family protein [Chthoniobacterales bacterium]
MKPTELSRQLRRDSGGFLEERRGIVCASLAAIGCMGLIALYQIGVIKHLPEPPLPGFDADKVDASEEAYSHFQVGDAFIGLGSYAATMGLAAMGPKNRAKTHPWIPLALAAKTAADAAQAAKLTYDQFAKHKAACMWCLIAAAATFVSAALAFPEARAAASEALRNIE